MSWSVGENTYPVSKSIKDINYEEEKMHEYNRGYFDPIYSEIHEIKVAKPLESYEEARNMVSDYISNHHGASACVRYMESIIDIEKINKKTNNFVVKAESEIDKLKEYTKKHSVSSQKAEFISCSCCKSKIAKKYIKPTRKYVNVIYELRPGYGGRCVQSYYEIDECPVCKAPMQNKTVKESIDNRLKKIYGTKDDFLNFVNEYMAKCKKEEYWYVYTQTYLG